MSSRYPILAVTVLLLVVSRRSIFTDDSPPDIAIWSETSLTYENGYTIIKSTHKGRSTGYMSREGIVTIDRPSAVMLDTTTIPGLYLISLSTRSRTTYSPTQSLATQVGETNNPQHHTDGHRDGKSPHTSDGDVLRYDAKGKLPTRPQDCDTRAYYTDPTTYYKKPDPHDYDAILCFKIIPIIFTGRSRHGDPDYMSKTRGKLHDKALFIYYDSGKDSTVKCGPRRALNSFSGGVRDRNGMDGSRPRAACIRTGCGVTSGHLSPPRTQNNHG
jgi:hypothetical protein